MRQKLSKTAADESTSSSIYIALRLITEKKEVEEELTKIETANILFWQGPIYFTFTDYSA